MCCVDGPGESVLAVIKLCKTRQAEGKSGSAGNETSAVRMFGANKSDVLSRPDSVQAILRRSVSVTELLCDRLEPGSQLP